MFKTKFILVISTIFIFSNTLQAKKSKVDEILVVQNLISQAHQLGYVNTAPIEMSKVEKKVVLAKQAKEKRKRKLVAKLIIEMKSDLKIIKKRFEVNELNQQLSKIQSQNLGNQQILDELQEQL